jgi:hypothetical protein
MYCRLQKKGEHSPLSKYRARIFKLLRSLGINSVCSCSLAGRYNNPIPTRFLAPIDCLKIPAQGVWHLLLNKKGSRSKMLILGKVRQVALAPAEHLLSPLSSPFFGAQFLYDYGPW